MKINNIILMFLMPFLLISTANAVQINFDKDSLNFNNVRREGYAFNTLTISTDSEHDIKLKYIVTGDIKNFIYVSAQNGFVFNRASPLKMPIEVKPDKSMANGIHTGEIIFTFDSLDGSQIDSQFSSYMINYNVDITDKVIKQPIVKEISIDDINIGGDIYSSVDIQNNGNVNFKPSLILKLKNTGGIEKKYSVYHDEYILPGQEKVVVFNVDAKDLSLGKYNLQANVMSEGNLVSEQIQDFYVLDKNIDIRKIILNKITNDDKVNVNKNLEILAFLYNNGPDKLVKLKTYVYLNDEQITTLESLETNAKSNDETQIAVNFKPVKTGNYKIHGFIEYGARKSKEIESAFEAIPETQNLKEVPLSSNPILAILIMIIAIFTVLKINKIKNKKK